MRSSSVPSHAPKYSSMNDSISTTEADAAEAVGCAMEYGTLAAKNLMLLPRLASVRSWNSVAPKLGFAKQTDCCPAPARCRVVIRYRLFLPEYRLLHPASLSRQAFAE